MNSKFLVFVVVLVVVVAVGADDDKKHEWKCKGEKLEFDKTKHEAMKKCWEDLKARNEKSKNKERKRRDADDKGGKKGCKKGAGMHFKPDAAFVKCKLEAVGAVADGVIKVDAINANVDKVFPKAVREDLKKALKECSDKVKDHKLTKDEDYGPFGKCQMKAVMKACKNDNEDDA